MLTREDLEAAAVRVDAVYDALWEKFQVRDAGFHAGTRDAEGCHTDCTCLVCRAIGSAADTAQLLRDAAESLPEHEE